MSAERRQPPIYTNRYLCPITGCGWHHDEPVRPDDPLAPWQGSLEKTVLATRIAQVQAVEQSIAGHLVTHPVLEWFREVRSQQDRAAKAEADLGQLRGQLGEEWGCRYKNGNMLRGFKDEADVRSGATPGVTIYRRPVGEWREVGDGGPGCLCPHTYQPDGRLVRDDVLALGCQVHDPDAGGGDDVP